MRGNRGRRSCRRKIKKTKRNTRLIKKKKFKIKIVWRPLYEFLLIILFIIVLCYDFFLLINEIMEYVIHTPVYTSTKIFHSSSQSRTEFKTLICRPALW